MYHYSYNEIPSQVVAMSSIASYPPSPCVVLAFSLSLLILFLPFSCTNIHLKSVCASHNYSIVSYFCQNPSSWTDSCHGILLFRIFDHFFHFFSLQHCTSLNFWDYLFFSSWSLFQIHPFALLEPAMLIEFHFQILYQLPSTHVLLMSSEKFLIFMLLRSLDFCIPTTMKSNIDVKDLISFSNTC